MIELKEFDISNIKKKPWVNILIIGKRNTGKSTLIKDILAHLEDIIPLVLAMSGTEGVQGFYKQMLPEICISDGVHGSRLTDLLERQQRFMKRIDRKKEGFTDVNPNVCVVLDDCISNTDWMKEDATVKFITEGRHIKMTLMTAVQEVKKLTPGFRANADYVFVFKTGSYLERKKIREEFLALFDSKAEFEYVMDTYTSDYKCIVLDNTTQSNDKRDQVFWYKANVNAQPRLCASIYYDLNDLIAKHLYEEAKRREDEKEAVPE